MWEAFLNRSCHSCERLDASRPQRDFGRHKLDINSVEYQSYLHKNVIRHFDKILTPGGINNSTRLHKKRSPRLRIKRDNMAEEKNDPVFFKIDLNKITDESYVPVETVPEACEPTCKSSCKINKPSDHKNIKPSSKIGDPSRKKESSPPEKNKLAYKNCYITIDKYRKQCSFKLWNPKKSNIVDDEENTYSKQSKKKLESMPSSHEESSMKKSEDTKLEIAIPSKLVDDNFERPKTPKQGFSGENAAEYSSIESVDKYLVESLDSDKSKSSKRSSLRSTGQEDMLDTKKPKSPKHDLPTENAAKQGSFSKNDDKASTETLKSFGSKSSRRSSTSSRGEQTFIKLDRKNVEYANPQPFKIAPQTSSKKPRQPPKTPVTVKKKAKSSALYVLKFNSQHSALKGKMYKFGEKGSGFKSKSDPQDFYKLRDEHVANGTLFEDPEFPATDLSLFFSQRPDRHFEWKRPGEIVDDPQLFVEGFSRFDVQQGELGDCWLLAATANLTLYRRLFFQIVPDDQDFDDNYAGIFHFRFWQYGKWIDVVIDDRLPTYRGQLVFLHSTEDNEFWSALLEKAYAKLHGSYEALKGGSTCEAMEDFTGGVTEMYELEASPPNLFQIMLKAYERASLMGCSIEPDPNVLEAQTPEGLVRGHAYSITRVQFVDIQTPNVRGKIPLLRLRNPWGNESEWNGAWSDGAAEWRFISESDKEELGLTFDNDGEFWMAYKDFQNHFSRVEICNLNPDSLTEDELLEGNKKKWEMSVYEGEWVRGVTAGGCRNFLETFWHNPQYRITLTEVDEDDEEGNCTLIVALMQKNRRQIRQTGVDLLTVGFAIYHLPSPDRVPKPLDLNFFKYNASVARSPSFINLREVSCRFKLPPGTYCIVPSTFDPNEEGEFLLRVFSENQNNMEEHDETIGLSEIEEKPISHKKAEVVSAAPEEKDHIYNYFLNVAGEDKEVDWNELKNVLDFATKEEFHLTGFSKDICRSMVAMLDADRSGKLGFDEFKKLWSMLSHWKNVWASYDLDHSGTFSGFELREALNKAGYRLNNKILNVIMQRYGDIRGEIAFDDFLMCAIKLKSMMEIFQRKDSEQNNTAMFTLEAWLENTLYS